MKLLLRATLALILFSATVRAVPLTLRAADADYKPIVNAMKSTFGKPPTS